MSYEPELGQMMFGQDYGDYEVPEFVEWDLLSLSTIIKRDDSMGEGAEFDSDVFTMRRYYWGDCTCGEKNNEHLPDCRVDKPNFFYRPTGLAVYWYKYIGRGMSANREITLDEWQDVYDHCRRTVREARP